MKAKKILLFIFLFSLQTLPLQGSRGNESKYMDCAKTTLITIQCVSLMCVLGLLATEHLSYNASNMITQTNKYPKYNFESCDVHQKDKFKIMEKCPDKLTALNKIRKKYDFIRPQHSLIRMQNSRKKYKYR